MTLVSHFIAGVDVPGSGEPTRERRNPSNATDLVATFPVGGAASVDAAVAAASAALDAWRRLPGPRRADALYRWGEVISGQADALAALISREVGKPIVEARGEVGRAVVLCRFYAGEAVREIGSVIPAQAGDTLQYTIHDPLGVVALVTPWNFPLAIPLWKAAPALAFGNTVVLKPSELAPAMGQALAATAREAGLPPGVFNVVQGDGTTGETLLRHADVRGISFTGSQRVGHRVRLIGAERNVPTQCEMGGKNVVIVAADADLDRAAKLTAAGAFRYAGQKCTATSRAIVDSAVGDAFIAKLKAATLALPLGPVDDPKCAIGPLISAASHARVTAALESAPAASLFEVPLDSAEPWSSGHWLAPRAVMLGTPDHPLAREELFAPVLGVQVTEGLESAIALANDTAFGLSASLFTRDLAAALEYVRRIEVGLVRVNGDTTGVDPHAPFGGLKSSSSGGREQGRSARDFYTDIRTIQIHG